MKIDEIRVTQDYMDECLKNDNHYHAQWVDLRPGHCNVNYVERKNAFDALLQWIKEIKESNLGPSSPEAPIRTSWGELFDSTKVLDLGPSEVVFLMEMDYGEWL